MRDLVLQPRRPHRIEIREPHKITGQFAGDRVNLTLETDRCPPRHGTAARRAAGSEAARDTALAMLRNPE